MRRNVLQRVFGATSVKKRHLGKQWGKSRTLIVHMIGTGNVGGVLNHVSYHWTSSPHELRLASFNGIFQRGSYFDLVMEDDDTLNRLLEKSKKDEQGFEEESTQVRSIAYSFGGKSLVPFGG